MTRPASRRAGGTALALLATVSLLAAGCTSRSGSKSTSSSTSTDAAVLGTPNKATGSPIKIGFINDGKGDIADTTGHWETAQAAVKYANDYLGGINGHVIDIDHCQTNYTSSGGTACGVQMVKDKVAIVIAPASAEDGLIDTAMKGSGIPYFALSSGDTNITGAPGNFVITDGLSALGAMLQQAKAKGIKKAGIVIIDVAAAAVVGPLTKPIFAKAGVAQDFIQIGASVADHTGRIQQAINGGTGAFTITGPNTFVQADLTALKQLQFKGPILISLNPIPSSFAAIPGGLAGITNIVSYTTDPNDPDVKIYNAVNAKYGANAAGFAPQVGFQSVIALVDALKGHTTAVDAKSIISTLDTMPQIKLPLGGGMTFQCGTHPVAITPNVCTTSYLQATLDAKGNATSYTLGDAKAFLAS